MDAHAACLIAHLSSYPQVTAKKDASARGSVLFGWQRALAYEKLAGARQCKTVAYHEPPSAWWCWRALEPGDPESLEARDPANGKRGVHAVRASSNCAPLLL